MGYLSRNSGETIVTFGTVTRDARRFDFDSGSMVVNFSIKYATQLNADGERSGKFFDVKVWGKDFDHSLCDYCACLEKGDRVLVGGELKKDKKPDQDGNDRWYLNAEFVIVQPTVQLDEPDYDPDETEPSDEPTPDYGGEDYPEDLQ